MGKKLKIVLVGFAGLMLLVIFGCSAMQDAVTPCFIEEDAIVYSDEEATSFLPFTTLWDAKRIMRGMDHVYLINQKTLHRLIEDEDIKYSFLREIQNVHAKSAIAFQESVFSPTGPIGFLMTTLFGGTLGALLIRRPGDIKNSK